MGRKSVHEFRCLLVAAEGVRFYGAGATSGCDSPNIGSGYRTQYSKQLSHLSSPISHAFCVLLGGFCLFVSMWALGIERKTSCLHSKYFTAELTSQPWHLCSLNHRFEIPLLLRELLFILLFVTVMDPPIYTIL